MSDKWPSKYCSTRKSDRTCENEASKPYCFWQKQTDKRKGYCNSRRVGSCSKEPSKKGCDSRTQCKWLKKDGKTAGHCVGRSASRAGRSKTPRGSSKTPRGRSGSAKKVVAKKAAVKKTTTRKPSVPKAAVPRRMVTRSMSAAGKK